MLIMEKCRNGQLNLPKNLIGSARDLVKQLLTDDPGQRLELAQMKEHTFFKDLNWDDLQNRKIKPPHRKKATSSNTINDTKNTQFTL